MTTKMDNRTNISFMDLEGGHPQTTICIVITSLCAPISLFGGVTSIYRLWCLNTIPYRLALLSLTLIFMFDCVVLQPVFVIQPSYGIAVCHLAVYLVVMVTLCYLGLHYVTHRRSSGRCLQSLTSRNDIKRHAAAHRTATNNSEVNDDDRVTSQNASNKPSSSIHGTSQNDIKINTCAQATPPNDIKINTCAQATPPNDIKINTCAHATPPNDIKINTCAQATPPNNIKINACAQAAPQNNTVADAIIQATSRAEINKSNACAQVCAQTMPQNISELILCAQATPERECSMPNNSCSFPIVQRDSETTNNVSSHPQPDARHTPNTIVQCNSSSQRNVQQIDQNGQKSDEVRQSSHQQSESNTGAHGNRQPEMPKDIHQVSERKNSTHQNCHHETCRDILHPINESNTDTLQSNHLGIPKDITHQESETQSGRYSSIRDFLRRRSSQLGILLSIWLTAASICVIVALVRPQPLVIWKIHCGAGLLTWLVHIVVANYFIICWHRPQRAIDVYCLEDTEMNTRTGWCKQMLISDETQAGVRLV